MTGMIKRISDWHSQLPNITRRAVTSSFLGSVFLIIGWAKFFFLEEGTLVDFGTSVVAMMISLLVILISGGMGIIGGLIQLLFIPPRRTGLVSMVAGIIPPLIYITIMFYLMNIHGLEFD